ncbi:hypothetical protein AKJ16_DCAP03281 [Drosera capensis]
MAGPNPKSPFALKVTKGLLVSGRRMSANFIVLGTKVANHDIMSTSKLSEPGSHLILWIYGLTNQCRAAVVEALRMITVDATAPFRMTFISGEVMKVITGPKDTERQQVERESSFTFLIVEEIGPW